MKVSTEVIGREIKVTVEGTNEVSPGVFDITTLTLDGSGTLSRAVWEGLTLTQIKANFMLNLDGENILGRDGTTLKADGEVNFNYPYAGTAYLIQLKLV